MHFHVRIILHCVGIPLQYEDGFSKVKNAYNESACYSICDDHGVDAYEMWINGDWFYYIFTQPKYFMIKGIEKVMGSMQPYIFYFLLLKFRQVRV